MQYLAIPAVAVLFLYYVLTSKSRKETVHFIILLLLGIALALYEGADIAVAILGFVVFANVAATIGSKRNYIFLVIAAAYLAAYLIAYLLVFNYSSLLIVQMMFFGLLSRAHLFREHNRPDSPKKEEERDIIQIFIGIGLILMLLIFANYARLLIITSVLGGVLLSNYAVLNKKSGIAKRLYALERGSAVFGQGAMWLTLGILLTLSFLNITDTIVVAGALFIGDSTATILGIRFGKTKLPYNKKKSIVGTVAYFGVTFLMALPFIGYFALLTAFVAAIVESLPIHIDDNFDAAIALIAVIKILGYAGLL